MLTRHSTVFADRTLLAGRSNRGARGISFDSCRATESMLEVDSVQPSEDIGCAEVT